jgi:hypothetical protein
MIRRVRDGEVIEAIRAKESPSAKALAHYRDVPSEPSMKYLVTTVLTELGFARGPSPWSRRISVEDWDRAYPTVERVVAAELRQSRSNEDRR